MKRSALKILASMLAIILLFPYAAVNAASAGSAAIEENGGSTLIFTSDMLKDGAGGKGVVSKGLAYNDGRIFLKYTASGSAANEYYLELTIPDKLPVTEYPYFKIGYKAYTEAYNDSVVSDINISVSGKRYWSGHKPTLDFSGVYSELCFSAKYISNGENGGKYSDFTADDTYSALRFMPWGVHTLAERGESDYFMIEYIAFFKTEEAADNYTTQNDRRTNALNISAEGKLALEGLSPVGSDRFAYMTRVSESGIATDNTSIIIKCGSDISIKSNPIVKLSYVSNISASSMIDFNVGVYIDGVSERLFGPRVEFIADGEPHTLTVDLSKLNYTGGSGALEDPKAYENLWDALDDKFGYLKLKPFDRKAMSKGEYFGIEYMMFFPTVEAAEAYTLPAASFEILGDVNSDGNADTLDVLYLARHLAGVSGYEQADESSADIDCDGRITASDLTLLARKLAAWDGYESLYFKVADDALVSTLDSEFEALKNTIIASDSEWRKASEANNVYYVSNNGNDQNDGLSPSSAFRTFKNLTSKKLKSGDVVLFERGGLWRERLTCVAGVTYSAYGSGAKPKLYGSVDAADSEAFTEVGTNLWLYNACTFDINSADIGAIIFNDGEAYGCRILDGDNGNLLKIGHDSLVSNGLEKWYRPVKAFSGAADLEHDLEYYLEPESGDLYIYSDKGNPGARFESVELSVKGNIVRGASDCTIDNLCLKYGASHGIGSGTVSNLTVRNCEIGWIGGAIQNYKNSATGRFGNGIEIYGGCDRFSVYNNYVYECFDCGLTVQEQGTLAAGSKMLELNAFFTNNAVERCNSPLEAWLTVGSEPDENSFKYMNNVVYEYNLCRDSGYGFGGYIHSKTDNNMFYGAGKTNAVMTNCYIRNNKMWRARKYIMKAVPTSTAHGKGFIWENNMILVNSGLFGLLGTDPAAADGNMREYKFDEPTLTLMRLTGALGKNRFYKYTLDGDS